MDLRRGGKALENTNSFLREIEKTRIVYQMDVKKITQNCTTVYQLLPNRPNTYLYTSRRTCPGWTLKLTSVKTFVSFRLGYEKDT